MNDVGVYSQQWQTIVADLNREVAALDSGERHWLKTRLGRIGRLQKRLHRLFLAAGGAQICRDCQGACCDCGRNHLTLVNLLAYLLADEQPPTPDFSRDCPFLGTEGCLLPPPRRPFNCVIFLCEAVEDLLGDRQRRLFIALEGRLRQLYDEFAQRYAGAGLRGLFIRSTTLAGRPYLHGPSCLCPAQGA